LKLLAKIVEEKNKNSGKEIFELEKNKAEKIDEIIKNIKEPIFYLSSDPVDEKLAKEKFAKKISDNLIKLAEIIKERL
jgi:hypothetical protein